MIIISKSPFILPLALFPQPILINFIPDCRRTDFPLKKSRHQVPDGLLRHPVRILRRTSANGSTMLKICADLPCLPHRSSQGALGVGHFPPSNNGNAFRVNKFAIFSFADSLCNCFGHVRYSAVLFTTARSNQKGRVSRREPNLRKKNTTFRSASTSSLTMNWTLWNLPNSLTGTLSLAAGSL